MQTKHVAAVGLLIPGLMLICIAGLMTGTADISFQEVLEALTGRDSTSQAALVVLQIRLPRLLLALATGGVLALSGFFMQALIKNPLADPYIMGLTAGAGFGVNLVILGLIPIASFSIFTYPTFAAAGALASLLLLMTLGYRSFFEDNAKLLIAGVAVASIFTALTGLMIYQFADSDQVRRLIFWTFGSFGKAGWEAVGVSFAMMVLAILFGLIYSRRLDLLLLGDMQARSLGIHASRLKFLLLVVSSVVVGGTVAFTGPIGFIGMMIPHFSRAVFGSNHRPNMVFGALIGGGFLSACDILSRWILPPAGLPVGIVTSILGVPFFLYILFSGKSYL